MKKTLIYFSSILLAIVPAKATSVEIRNNWPMATSIQYLIASNTRIKKGDVIAVRDCAPLIDEVNRLNILIDQLSTEDHNLKSQLEEAKSFAKGGNPALKANLEQAQLALDRYVTNEALLTELTLQQAAAEATTALSNATVRFNARDKMLQEGFIQKTEYDMEESRFNSAKLAKDSAQARLEKFEKIEKPKAVQELQRKVDAEKTALQRAEAQNQLLVLQLPEKIDAQGKRIAALREVLSQNLRYLAEISMLAPVDGVFSVRSFDAFPPVATNSSLGPNELLGKIESK